MQPPQAVVVSQPYVIANEGSTLSVGVKSARGLGITQIIIGSITILFGILTIAFLQYWAAYVGFAIWGGIWIVIGGILGVCSAANPASAGLNWTNMAFAIVSTCVMFIDFIIYCIAVGQMNNVYNCNYGYYYNCYYNNNATGVGLYSVLLVLSVIEFAIGLTVSICCCKYGCNGCCYGDTRGMVIQQPHMVPSSVVVQSSAHTGYQGAVYPPASYPATSYPAASYPAASYPQAFGSSAPPAYSGPQQGTYTSAGNAAVPHPVAMTYGQGAHLDKQGGPPPYQ